MTNETRQKLKKTLFSLWQFFRQIENDCDELFVIGEVLAHMKISDAEQLAKKHGIDCFDTIIGFNLKKTSSQNGAEYFSESDEKFFLGFLKNLNERKFQALLPRLPPIVKSYFADEIPSKTPVEKLYRGNIQRLYRRKHEENDKSEICVWLPDLFDCFTDRYGYKFYVSLINVLNYFNEYYGFSETETRKLLDACSAKSKKIKITNTFADHQVILTPTAVALEDFNFLDEISYEEFKPPPTREEKIIFLKEFCTGRNVKECTTMIQILKKLARNSTDFSITTEMTD